VLRHCHTVEVWQDGQLTGGLYGVHLGRAFFGESMFSRARDASKIALVYLIARLKYGGFTLLDTQFVTGHLARFGAIEVSREEFQRFLEAALAGGFAQGSGSGASAAGGPAGGFGAGGASAAAGGISAGGASAASAGGAGSRGIRAVARGRGPGRRLAAREPDVEDRVLYGVKSRAFREHPAGENPLHLARKLNLIHFYERRGVRRFGRRARVANPGRHL
jgi:hypothetical protein